ncbi:MAG TPA: hypothetical protein VER79_14245 [Candidatus Limnocylindrales bacterium]|nr:hypothetical protein [Candidatus Limnocylindrales bacterium]
MKERAGKDSRQQNATNPIAKSLHNHLDQVIASHQPHSLLHLQSTIGNRAVVRHLQKQNRIQRATETGLASPAARGRYTLELSSWRNEHVSDTPPVEVFVLIDEAADQGFAVLGRAGIPKPDKVLDPQAPASLDGQFRAPEWSLLLNPQMVAPLNTPLTSLTDEQLLRIVNVVYHELRHCEQYFNIARFLAGTGIEASEIATTMDIPENVAQAAHANPLKMVVTNGLPMFGGDMPSISAEYFEAWLWYRQVYGKLGKYSTGVYDILQDIWSLRASLNDVIADPSRADIAFNMDTIITTWKDERIPNVLEAYKATLEASPFNFEMDQQALRDINRILPAMREVITQWDAISSDFTVLKPPLDQLYDVVKQAYEAMLTEKDAHVLGDQVTEDFKTMAGL